jgi:RNA polymerase sigma-70 factor (family 1)
MNLCNHKTFETVYKKYSDGLYNYLYYTFGNQTDAEDVTQNVFLKLWERCNSVSLENIKSYLYTLGRNECLNIKKHEKVKIVFQKQNTLDFDIESPEFKLEKNEFEQKLELAISNLKEGERQVFLMNRIDKKKYFEIAEELNLSVKTIEKRMHNALIYLRTNIKEFNR